MSIPKATTTRQSLGPRVPRRVEATQDDASVTSEPVRSVSSSFVEADRSKLTVFVDAALHRRFKAAAAASGQNMRDVVEELLENWVKAQ